MPFAPFRFAVVTDLHAGASTANHWHNHFLSDEPLATVAATLAAVNAGAPDFVAVLGDISDHAADVELCAARATLDQSTAPWFVCRGNHDVSPAGETAAWQRHFGDRAPVGVLPAGRLPLPEGVAAVVFDGSFGEVEGVWRANLDPAAVEAARATLQHMQPDLLLVFCHFPFVRQSEHVRRYDGKNAGTLWEGERALQALAETAGATLCFAGHQHFHHIATSAAPAWLHCTTASQAEFPAEFRVVTVAPGQVTLATERGAEAIVAAAAPPQVTWPAGRTEDRECTWCW